MPPPTYSASSGGPARVFRAVPVYSLRAAGGPFLESLDAHEIGKAKAPENLKIVSKEHWIGRIEGDSMAPRIPSGSYCLFRFGVGGWRYGKTVLVELETISGYEYTLARYGRPPQNPEEGGLVGEVPLIKWNPEHGLIPIEEGMHTKVIAEFVQVMKSLEWIKPLYEAD